MHYFFNTFSILFLQFLFSRFCSLNFIINSNRIDCGFEQNDAVFQHHSNLNLLEDSKLQINCVSVCVFEMCDSLLLHIFNCFTRWVPLLCSTHFLFDSTLVDWILNIRIFPHQTLHATWHNHCSAFEKYVSTSESHFESFDGFNIFISNS